MGGGLATLLAVAGTLLGAVVTHLFQRKAADRAQGFAVGQQLRSDRLNVYSDFAGAVTEFRRGQEDRWHRKNEDAAGQAYIEARTESYRLRGVALQALFRVQLIASSQGLVHAAKLAYDKTSVVHRANDSGHLSANGNEATTTLEQFISLASGDVR
ncbi:hypothetical protein [Streptomyces albidus (ex Kaewkla and Franco 2022)]|uniref:hypothetical protein n=1 Tax=Streptomyces albidus (ex Kaewkla and Franco 2022) TaxID=722709 RepID=UPI0015EFC101|nr:hypothetical protein [Streptomyces albidus (ex Kaewkla and Franco 2022)]